MDTNDTRAANRLTWQKTVIWLSLCTLLAFTVHTWMLGGQSLWWDESLSLHRAQRTFLDILRNVIDLTDGTTTLVTIDNHPPLYFLVIGAAVRLLGASEFALRLPSALFSVLIIPLLFATGKRLFSENAGRFAALAGALSPMYLWYGQEARPYMMAAFLALLSLYSLLRSFDRREQRRRLWTLVYIVVALAMLLTHYLTFLVLAVELLIMLLAAARGSHGSRWTWALGVVMLAASLILLYLLWLVPAPQPQGGFSFVPLPVLARDVLNAFSLGLSVNVDDVIFLDLLFFVVALTGMLVAGTNPEHSQPPASLILVLFLLVPFALTYLAGYVRPIYMNSRHLIIVTPAFYLALGAGLAELLPRRGLLAATLLVMVVGVVYSWGQYFQNPIYHKDDHRAWGEYLRANVQPGDTVIVNPAHIYDLFRYYADVSVSWVGLPRLDNAAPDATTAELQRLAAQKRNLWLAVSATPPWGDPNGSVEKWLDANLTKTASQTFHTYASDVRVVRYATKPPITRAVPAIAVAASVDLDGKVEFLGYDPVNLQAEPRQSLSFSLYLRTEATLNKDMKASLRLVDDTGRVWAQSDQVVAGWLTQPLLPAGSIIREDLNLVIPPGAPAGKYHAEAVLYSKTDMKPLASPAGESRLRLSDVEVLHPRRATGAALSGAPALGQAGPLALISSSAGPDSLYQGETLSLDLMWRAQSDPGAEYVMQLSLVDDKGTVVAESVFPMGQPEQGTMTWRAGDVVRTQPQLDIPRTLVAGSYEIRVRVQNTASGRLFDLRPAGWRGLVPGSHVAIAHVTVLERPRSYMAPAIAHPLAVTFGGEIALLGYDLQPDQGVVSVHPGGSLTLTLHYQALSEMAPTYKTFVHVIEDDGHMWTQQDVVTGGERHPTSVWARGEVASDTIHVTLPRGLPKSRLSVLVGIYDPLTAKRLPIAGAGGATDSLPLIAVIVVP